MTSPCTELAVPAEMAGRRLDHFLTAALPELSRSRLQELIRAGHVEINGVAAVRPGVRLHGAESVRVQVVERPPLRATPEDIPLDVLYEDGDVIAINKPAGMVVHAGAGAREGTLVNALLHRFTELSGTGGPLRPGIVHRLDKETSGVVLVAKNNEAHRLLAAQFARRTVEKRYLALVHGVMKEEHGHIRLPVARDRVRRTRMTARRREGRPAETEYRVLESTEGFSLLEVFPHTGRTHQVRVHLSALGRPVVGDTTYGAPRVLTAGNLRRPTLNRNFLHAQRIGFCRPSSGEPVAVAAPLPEELRALLQALGFRWEKTD